MISKIKKYFYKHLFAKPYPSFYLVNAIGWFTFISIDSIITGAQYEWRLGLAAYLANFSQWSVGFIVTSLIRLQYKKLYRSKINFWLKLVYVTLISIFAAFWIFALALFVFALHFHPGIIETLLQYSNAKYFLYRMTQLVPMITAWSMLYFGIKLWIDVSNEREKADKANLLTQNAQLQMLRYQVNPHFLFNSFSSLRALIRKNPTAAAEMVTKLSEFYRYSLLPKSSSMEIVENEIEAIQFYVDIEKIRFEDRIHFDFKIDEKTKKNKIPAFIIHPLVENAVKYGARTSTIPLKISIETYLDEEDLVIKVMNSGKWFLSPNNIIGTGTGLSNIKNRLELLYSNKYSFDINKNENSVEVTIKIPREIN